MQDRRASTAHVVRADQRRHLRLDKVFPVRVSTSAYGDCRGIGRNISQGGMFVETHEPLPLGTVVRVHFALATGADEIVALGEVKNQYYLNYADAVGPRSLCGMGVRFVSFEPGGETRLETCLSGALTLH